MMIKSFYLIMIFIQGDTLYLNSYEYNEDEHDNSIIFTMDIHIRCNRRKQLMIFGVDIENFQAIVTCARDKIIVHEFINRNTISSLENCYWTCIFTLRYYRWCKIWSFRLKLRFSCMMDLYRFPMDSQVCAIELASCKSFNFMYFPFVHLSSHDRYTIRIFLKYHENHSLLFAKISPNPFTYFGSISFSLTILSFRLSPRINNGLNLFLMSYSELCSDRIVWNIS